MLSVTGKPHVTTVLIYTYMRQEKLMTHLPLSNAVLSHVAVLLLVLLGLGKVLSCLQ